MHRLSDITFDHRGRTDVRVAITLRTPEVAKALSETGWSSARLIFGVGAVALIAFAWHGGFGDTAHGYIRLTIAIAVLFWASDTAHRLMQARNRLTAHRLDVTFLADRVAVTMPDGAQLTFKRGR